jgi:hypothetical protein
MRKLIVLLAILLSFPLIAEELDSASQEALSQTQALMKNQSERQKYVNAHPDAKAADKKIDDLTLDPILKEKFYDVSGDIFANMVKKTGGDAEKQKEMLNEAAKNPEAFYNQLTPDEQNQIRSLANQIQMGSPPR